MRSSRLVVMVSLLSVPWLATCRDFPTDPETAQLAESATGRPSADTETPQAREDQLIPNRYLVIFQDDLPDVATLARSLAGANGLSIRHTYSHAIKGFAAEFPEAGRDAVLQALQRNPHVRYVEQDRLWYIDTHEMLTGAVAVPAPPADPSDLVTSAQGANAVGLTWSDNSSDETGFQILRCEGGTGCGIFEEVGSTGKNKTAFSDTGLQAATVYCYEVRAVGGRGKKRTYSQPAGPACATTDSGDTPPPTDERPTDLSAAPSSSTTMDLSWTDNWDNETGFEIERCQGTACSSFQVGADVTNYTDSGLTADTEYCYRVRGVRIRGKKSTQTEYSNIDCGTTLAPPPPPSMDPPTNQIATVLSSTSVSLTWTDNSDEDAFEIERCEGTACSPVTPPIGQVGADVTSYTDSGLTADTEYCYQVRGVVGATPTGYSNTDCATPHELPEGECPDTGNHDDLTQLWGISKTQANLNPTWLGTQTGGSCAIQAWFFGIDSGVDSDHPDLNVIEAVDFINDGSGPEDGHGHGTHTAGSATAIDGNGGVVGMAPGAPVFGFKVCGADGSCSLSAILAAVDEVSARKAANPNQPMVANMSLGGDPSVAMEDAVRNSINAGVVYAIGAGNGLIGACIFPVDAAGFSPALVGDDDINASGGSDGDTKPINGAITVTSSTENDTDANCNYGAPVTVAAPGTNIYSTIHNGGYGLKSGTSMATPHVAGAALLYLQNSPAATPEEVEAAIVGSLDPWTTNEQPNASGRLNAGSL